jgi:uncharacterized protein (DUF1778 family)
MASDDVRTSNLPAFYGADKTDWPSIGGRAHPDAVAFIDEASEARGLKRAHFIIEASIEKAERVLGKRFEMAKAS